MADQSRSAVHFLLVPRYVYYIPKPAPALLRCGSGEVQRLAYRQKMSRKS
jgi:hypothetical protein